MNLLEQLLAHIQKAAIAGDLDRIARLNQMAKRVREIEEGRKAFEAELRQIAAELNDNLGAKLQVAPPPVAIQAAPPGPITVEIDFPRLGVNHQPVVISEKQASDTMRKVMEALVLAKGIGILQPLSLLRINRGPIVSSNPIRDYTNPQTGQPYASQPIGTTGYSVLTHSATNEKIRDLGSVAKTLGLSSLHFRVRKN